MGRSPPLIAPFQRTGQGDLRLDRRFFVGGTFGVAFARVRFLPLGAVIAAVEELNDGGHARRALYARQVCGIVHVDDLEQHPVGKGAQKPAPLILCGWRRFEHFIVSNSTVTRICIYDTYLICKIFGLNLTIIPSSHEVFFLPVASRRIRPPHSFVNFEIVRTLEHMAFDRFRFLPLLGGLLFLLLASSSVQARPVSVASPDGRVKALVSDERGVLTYRVSVDGKPILDPSPLGIRSNGVDLGRGVAIQGTKRGKVAERYPYYGGKRWAENKANTAKLLLASNGVIFSADVHVANDGVAVRLRLPALVGRKIEAEQSGWRLAETDARVWTTEFLPDYENLYKETTLAKLGEKAYGLPLTAKVNGIWVTLSEAAVVDYGDSSISLAKDGTLAARMYADPNGWSTDQAVVQPWRVTIIARDLTALVNSTLVQNLNPPAAEALAKARWIRPGVSTWQWLAIGEPLENDQPQWIDWTRELGYDYYLIDDGWAKWTDPWSSLANTVKYARQRDIGIWVWIHSHDVEAAATRQSLFRKLADIGVVGVKVDFPGQANRDWSNWYIDTARDAATEHLMVDFHGASKPTGTERTWPNVLTREAVRGHEWQITRYKRKLSAEHDTILPFTRYVVGAADYTPTVFEMKELQGNSWAHELAQMIMFNSPYLSMGGHPATYISNPALELLKTVPSTWDETIVLEGSEPGKMAMIARRSGDDWFISAINNGDPRTLVVGLKFLKAGSWQMVQYADDAGNPASYERRAETVTSASQIALSMRARGGYVAHFRKGAAIPSPR